MRIIGLPLLETFKVKHAKARVSLEAWQAEVERSVLVTPQDMKLRYKSADFLPGNRVIFNIKGNSYRLVVQIRYQSHLVLIEWVGTHAAYTKKTF